MSKFPQANYRDLTKVTKKLGFYLCRQASDSHEVWRRDRDGRQTTLFNHGSKAVKRKTIKAILEDLNISPGEFLKLKKGKR
jgi:predicted RNA binding protein YcfA (HicA-like mRNA interferase family)